MIDTSYVQRHLWDATRHGGVVSDVRALRLCGRLEPDRLVAAIVEVVNAFEVLRLGFRDQGGVPVMVPSTDPPALRRTSVAAARRDRDEQCAALLRQERDRPVDPCTDPLAQFHVIDLGAEETVLALVAHPLVLDLRSIYDLLGAVMLAYFGRFRVAQYRPFVEVAGARPVTGAAVWRSRRTWWARRLEEWQRADRRDLAAGEKGSRGVRRTETLEVPLRAERWNGLTQLAGEGGNTGWLAAIALVAWWLRTRSPGRRPPVFGTTLDLRDYLGLGSAIGPLTDRIAFDVDLEGFHDMSFRDLLRRSHAGLLDAVVHYLPYGDLVALGIDLGILRTPHVARFWDIGVSYCPLPPASSYTRGEETLARRGFSIELFCEAALTRSERKVPEGAWDGSNLELHVAELGREMALVVNFNALLVDRDEVGSMLHDLDEAIDRVLADPDVAVKTL